MTVFLYLAAIVAANLAVARFGPGSSIIIAFLFIGLDLTLRDRLHDSWRGNGLAWRMGLLIATGGAISYLLNVNAGRIAIASTVAFAGAATVDAIVYHFLRDRPFMVRANGSNVPAAAVDSILFPTIAFGGWMPWIVLGQFAAKVGGGFLWSLILRKGKTDVHHRQNIQV